MLLWMSCNICVFVRYELPDQLGCCLPCDLKVRYGFQTDERHLKIHTIKQLWDHLECQFNEYLSDKKKAPLKCSLSCWCYVWKEGWCSVNSVSELRWNPFTPRLMEQESQYIHTHRETLKDVTLEIYVCTCRHKTLDQMVWKLKIFSSFTSPLVNSNL